MALRGDEIIDFIEQGGMATGAHFRIAEFAYQPIFDFTAELGCHGLHAVTDSQYRHAEFKYSLRSTWRVAFHHRIRAARQNHPGRTIVADEIVRYVVRKNFRKNTGVADTAGKVSNRIINEVRGINRVVYDISGKPPATIEWE